MTDNSRIHAISVVVPVYNERDAVAPTLAALHATLAAIEIESEVVVVNDGSNDGTAELLRSQPGIRLVEHERNAGYGASLKTGIRHARQDWILIVDADGSYPLDSLPQLLAEAEDADMVVGARTGHPTTQARLRSLPKWFLRQFAQWIARRPIPDLNSGLRLLRRPIVEQFLNILPDGFSFTTTITLAMLTNRYRVRYVPIPYQPRMGRSKIQPIRDTLRFLQLILRTGMYFAPLRVLLPVAALFFLGFVGSLGRDLWRGDLTESTLLLLVAATQVGMFALLADMIDKRAR